MNVAFIRPGERVPYGVSKHSTGHRIKFPLWICHRSGWDPVRDEVVKGRWTFEVCIRTELAGFAVHWGWNLIEEKDNG
jgi:hypothetical protein